MSATAIQREKILGELGATWVTYQLVLNGWEVYRKLNENGSDLMAKKDGVEFYIEVKSRDLQASTGKNRNSVTVGLSNSQREKADFLAVYVFGSNDCLILPTRHPVVRSSTSRNGLTVGNIRETGFIIKEEFQEFLNNFSLQDYPK